MDGRHKQINIYDCMREGLSSLGLDVELTDLKRFYTTNEILSTVKGLQETISEGYIVQVDNEFFLDLLHQVHKYKLKSDEIPEYIGKEPKPDVIIDNLRKSFGNTPYAAGLQALLGNNSTETHPGKIPRFSQVIREIGVLIQNHLFYDAANLMNPDLLVKPAQTIPLEKIIKH